MELSSYFSDFYQFWIGSFIGLVILCYIYLTWNFDYWKKQGIPGVTPHLIIGTLKPAWTSSFRSQDVDAMKKFGHIHGGFMGRRPLLFISDPDLLKQVLVKDFQAFPQRTPFGNASDELLGNMLTVMQGEKWKMVRNTLTPAYTSGKLKQMVSLIDDCIQHLITSLNSAAENGEPIEFTRKFPLLTLDIIASCAFGMNINCIDNPDSDFVTKCQKAFRSNPSLFYFSLILPGLFKLIPKALLPNPFKYFIDIANQTIDMRLKNKDFSRRDFLQIMLEAEIPAEDNGKNENDSKKKLTREVIVAQTVLFILAGHETTSNTASCAAYELAQNMDIQEKLIKEIDDMMSHSEGKLSYDTLSSMQYLDMVVSEVLRIHPPGLRLDRECVENGYNLNGITLREGISIAVPTYAMHHNPEFFPNPSVFDPERFSPENKRERNPFTYLPFGAGPRNCIAMRFALLEAKLIIAHMLYHYRFLTCEETEYPLKFGETMGLLQPLSVKLILQKRVEHSSN